MNLKHRRLSFVTMLFFLLTQLLAVGAEPQVSFNGFNDIEGHWAQFLIELNAKRGRIAGYEDGSFRPSQSVTRAEFVTMANKFFDRSGGAEFGCTFTDVNEDDWFFADVATAEKARYISGYPDGTFRPKALITREEATVILCRLIDFDPRTHADNIEFADSESISPWAYGYVNRLVYNHLIKGYPDNTFRPKNPVTRAEAVVLLDNARMSMVDTPLPSQDIPGSYGESPSPSETATPSPTPSPTQDKTGDKQTGKEPSKAHKPTPGVVNSAPEIDAVDVSTYTAYKNEKVRLTAFTYDANNDILSYSWSADGGTIEGNSETAVWTAPELPGEYNITLKVSDGKGGKASTTRSIKVVEPVYGLDNPLDLIQDDGDEDGDNLLNSEEKQIGTNPFISDSDYDGLSDYEELKIYGTNPLEMDSDSDGLLDGAEVALKLDPNKESSDGVLKDGERVIDFKKDFTISVSDSVYSWVGTLTSSMSDETIILSQLFEEETSLATNKEAKGTIEMSGNGNLVNDIEISTVDNPLLCAQCNVVGLPVKIESKLLYGLKPNDMTVILSYDPSEVQSKGIDENDLRLYTYDPVGNNCSLVENSTVDIESHTITGTSCEMSTYVMGVQLEDTDFTEINLALVIDMSENMLGTDYQNTYGWKRELEDVISTVNDVSTVSLSQFTGTSYTIQELTRDKSTVLHLLNDMEYAYIPEEGDLLSGFGEGISVLDDAVGGTKVMLLLTATYNSSQKSELVDLANQAASKGIIVYIVDDTRDENARELKEIAAITGGRYFHIDYHYSQANDIILDLNSVKDNGSIPLGNLYRIIASSSMAALQTPADDGPSNFYDIKKDSWSFRNQASYIGPRGLCAGFVTTSIGNFYQVLPLSISTDTAIGNNTLSYGASSCLYDTLFTYEITPDDTFSLQGSSEDIFAEWDENKIAYNLRLFDGVFEFGNGRTGNNIYDLEPTNNLSSTQDTIIAQNPNWRDSNIWGVFTDEREHAVRKAIESWYVIANTMVPNEFYRVKSVDNDKIPKEIVEYIVNSLKRGDVLYVGIWALVGGHALLAYAQESDEELNTVTLSIYDCNTPYSKDNDDWKDCKIVLTRNEGLNTYTATYIPWEESHPITEFCVMKTSELLSYMYENSTYIEKVTYDADEDSYTLTTRLPVVDTRIQNYGNEDSPVCVVERINDTNFVIRPVNGLGRRLRECGFQVEFNIQIHDGLTEWVTVFDHPETQLFTDVSISDWYYEYIKEVVKKGYMQGTGNKRFDPDLVVTRAQIITIALNMAGIDYNNHPALGESGDPFTDVASGSWYYNAVKVAKKLGYVSGYGDGSFGPNDPVQRQHVATMLVKILDLFKEPPEGYYDLPMFSDERDISGGQLKDVKKIAYNRGWEGFYTSDSETPEFRPKLNITRAEFAKIIYKLTSLDEYMY